MPRSLYWLVTWVLLAAPARGGSLASGSVFVHTDRSISCSVWNSGEKPIRDVVLELVYLSDPPDLDVVQSSGPLDLPPGQVRAVLEVADQAFEQGEYACRAAYRGGGKTLHGALRLKLPPDTTETLLPMQ